MLQYETSAKALEDNIEFNWRNGAIEEARRLMHERSMIRREMEENLKKTHFYNKEIGKK